MTYSLVARDHLAKKFNYHSFNLPYRTLYSIIEECKKYSVHSTWNTPRTSLTARIPSSRPQSPPAIVQSTTDDPCFFSPVRTAVPQIRYCQSSDFFPAPSQPHHIGISESAELELNRIVQVSSDYSIILSLFNYS